MSATSHPEAANRPPYPTAWLSLPAVLIAVIWGLCFLLIQSSLDETTPFFAAGMPQDPMRQMLDSSMIDLMEQNQAEIDRMLAR